MNEEALVFTDGAAKGNPGPGGWAAILAEGDTVTELGGHEPHTTNNRMELTAAIMALENSKAAAPALFTDSSYLINGITKWVPSWQRRGWQTIKKENVLNRDLWEALAVLTAKKNISWHYVGGHVGVPGNERTDAIATAFADGKHTRLFKGTRRDYPVNLTKLAGIEASENKKNHSRAKAYSYVSLVNGEIRRHDTWASCEAAVRGKPNARFRKVTSAREESALIADWKKSLRQ
ncbi:MAG: ribonuclease HI [bacterium]|nr:ribonuclease HI [bacterium]